MTTRENSPTELTESFDERRDSPNRHDGRYADFTTEDGIVVYDRDHETAWIASDTTVDPEEAV